MKHSKHTPGPWSFVTRSDDRGLNSYVGPVEDIQKGEANARLIASSPELLEACIASEYLIDSVIAKQTSEHYDILNETLHYLRSAIAKATGGAK